MTRKLYKATNKCYFTEIDVKHIEEYLTRDAFDIDIKTLRKLVPQLLAGIVYGRDHLKTKKKCTCHVLLQRLKKYRAVTAIIAIGMFTHRQAW